MNVIEKITYDLKDELTSLNSVILGCIKNDVELIEVVSQHLINAGGKRIRPILTILCSKLFGYRGKLHINLAAAVEFIHTATLLHDDVVDESTVRRSLPTANVVWGSKASILVGDFLFSQAFIQMVHGNSIKALESLSNASSLITEGEVMQLANMHQINMTEEEYFKVIKRKTAELFATSCEIGGIISDQPDFILQSIKEYGKNLGIIFQLTDDLLDYFASQEELGKNLGADFKEGKVTLPVIYAYQNGDDTEKDFWNRTMVHLNQNDEDFSYAVSLMKKYDIYSKVELHIKKLRQSTLDILLNIPQKNKYYDLLMELIDFVIDRKK